MRRALEDEFALPNNFRSYLQALEAGVHALMLDVRTVETPNNVNEEGWTLHLHTTHTCALKNKN